MIAYAIYTIITLICIRSHICSFILRFSYFSIIHKFLYFPRAYIYSFLHSYIPIIHVHVLFLYFVIFYLSLLFLAFMHLYQVFLTCSIYSIRYVFHIFISHNLIFILYHSLVTSYILLTYIFMFHEHIYTYLIFYIFLVSCLLHMAFHILLKYDVYEITPHLYILIPL